MAARAAAQSARIAVERNRTTAPSRRSNRRDLLTCPRNRSPRDPGRLGRALFADLEIQVEIRNQARVHIWYPQRFGSVIEPYRSVEHAIATWPTTAAAVHLDAGRVVITAPFGLHDLFAMIARPNKAQITEDIYENKVRRWTSAWPQLQVISWSEAG